VCWETWSKTGNVVNVDISLMFISAPLFHLICELLVLIRCISLVAGASRVMLVYLIM